MGLGHSKDIKSRGALPGGVSGDGNAGVLALPAVGIIGDSRMDAEDLMAATIDHLPMQGVVGVTCALLGQRFRVTKYAGVGGNNTDQVVSRMAADLGPGLGAIVFMCDINDVLATPRTITLEQTKANYRRLYDYAKGIGAQVFHIGPYPPNGAVTAAQAQDLLNLRQWILSVPAEYPHVYAIDAWSIIADPTSNPPTAQSKYIVDVGTDLGKHINGAGGFAIASRGLLPVMRQQISPADRLICSVADSYVVDATRPDVNLLENPLMAGTNGTKFGGVLNALAWATATAYLAGQIVINAGRAYLARAGGTSGATAPTHNIGSVSDGMVVWDWLGDGAAGGVAAGYTVQRTGTCTVYVCTVDRPDGVGKDQILGMVNGSASEVLAMWSDNATARAEIGASYYTDAEIGVTAVVGLAAPSLELATNSGGQSKTYRALSASNTTQDTLMTDCTLTPRTRPALMASPITQLKPQLLPQFTGIGCRGVIRIGRWACRRVG